MHHRSRRRSTGDGEVCSASSPSQLGAGWTLTACCLLGCCLSAVPGLCSAFGSFGVDTASPAAARRRKSLFSSRFSPIVPNSSAVNSHNIIAATALGAATTATFEDVAALSLDDVPRADGFDDDDETTNVGVLLLNLGGPETGEDVEGEQTRSAWNLHHITVRWRSSCDCSVTYNLISPLSWLLILFLSHTTVQASCSICLPIRTSSGYQSRWHRCKA